MVERNIVYVHIYDKYGRKSVNRDGCLDSLCNGFTACLLFSPPKAVGDIKV